mgnify:CR=1 FL=1
MAEVAIIEAQIQALTNIIALGMVMFFTVAFILIFHCVLLKKD